MRPVLPMLLVLSVVLPASAQQAGGQADAMALERGRALAGQWCGACHATSSEAAGPQNDAAPAFPVIAGRPGASAQGIATYLGVPHASMPDLGLTALQAMDLGLYVMDQKPR